MTNSFDSLSLVAIYSALSVYVLAFVFFAMDLAKRSATAGVTESQSQATVQSVKGSVKTLERTETKVAATKDLRFEKTAFALSVIAWILHATGAVFRGIADGHVPWSNMFEFSLVSSAIIVGVFLAIQAWQNLKFLGTYVVGFALVVLGIGTVNFYVAVTPLPPALQSYWLVIHVFVASLATAFFGLGAGLSLTQLIQTSRETGRLKRWRFLATLPDSEQLENLAYRVIVVGFVLWSFTLIAGAIWAERAWGRFWGWDTKEVWTFIIWVLFAGYIHARATRGWRGTRSAWLALVGMSAVAFNYTIVNLFFKGLHTYSGL